MKRIWLIGGLSPESTIHYYKTEVTGLRKSRKPRKPWIGEIVRHISRS